MHLGRYEIIEELGRGAMGVVYKARDPLLNRIVAIKTMSAEAAENDELRSRLEREAQLAAKLRHPNIITIYDVGEEEGIPFIAMEFLEGIDLRHITSQNIPLYPSEKWAILKQLCLGLHHAHKEGVVHRDIKPGNIRLLRDGTVKIMDFGIARVASSQLTQAGMVLGSVNYMSPEQVEGRKVDHRSDIFSVGILAYELLSYRLPFKSDSMSSTMFNILKGEHHPLDPVALKLPPGVNDIIVKCLEKRPEDRPQDVVEIVHRLDALASEIRNETPSDVSTPIGERPAGTPAPLPGEDPEATVVGDPQAADPSTTIQLWVHPHRFQRISESIEKKLPKKPTRVGVAPPLRSPSVTGLAPTRAVTAFGIRRHAPLLAATFFLLLVVLGLGSYWLSNRAEVEKERSELQQVISTHMAEAASRLAAEDYRGAIEELEKVLEAAPAHEEAERALMAAQQAQREQLSELVARGREMLRAGRFQDAIAALEQADGADPGNEDVEGLLAEAKEGAERTTEAGAAFERGLSALEGKDYARSVKELERALELDPEHREAQERLRFARTELARPRFGTLTVNAIPFGEVFLDGATVGVTPVNLEKVRVGGHTLRVIRSGYEEFQRTVVVEEGQARNVVAELVKKP